MVNDANQVIWRHFGVQSWPTLVLIDANGKYLGALAGEGHYESWIGSSASSSSSTRPGAI